MLQWKYKKPSISKQQQNSRRQAQNQPPRWQRKLLYHLTLLKFEPAHSSVWQLQPDCWEERGSTFRFTGAGVEEKASEIFAATVLRSRAMPVAASTQWWPTRKQQKTIPVVKTISVGAKLSQIYTNHSVRVSAITMLSDANVPDRHIMFISGHSSEQSVAHYSSRPSVSQLESVSDTILSALENHQPQSTQISTVTSAPLMQSSNRMASNVSMSTATVSFPSGFFNFSNIQGNVQVFFGFTEPLWWQKVTWFFCCILYRICWLRNFDSAFERIVSSRTSDAQFKFDSGVILWTNHNSLLSIATNQFA